MDFFNFCWVFQKFPFFCVTLYLYFSEMILTSFQIISYTHIYSNFLLQKKIISLVKLPYVLPQQHMKLKILPVKKFCHVNLKTWIHLQAVVLNYTFWSSWCVTLIGVNRVVCEATAQEYCVQCLYTFYTYFSFSCIKRLK